MYNDWYQDKYGQRFKKAIYRNYFGDTLGFIAGEDFVHNWYNRDIAEIHFEEIYINEKNEKNEKEEVSQTLALKIAKYILFYQVKDTDRFIETTGVFFDGTFTLKDQQGIVEAVTFLPGEPNRPKLRIHGPEHFGIRIKYRDYRADGNYTKIRFIVYKTDEIEEYNTDGSTDVFPDFHNKEFDSSEDFIETFSQLQGIQPYDLYSLDNVVSRLRKTINKKIANEIYIRQFIASQLGKIILEYEEELEVRDKSLKKCISRFDDLGLSLNDSNVNKSRIFIKMIHEF